MDNKRSFLASGLVHLLIIGLLSVNIIFTPVKKKSDRIAVVPVATEHKPVIQAGVIPKSMIDNALKRQQHAEQSRKSEIQHQQRQIQQAKKEAEQQKQQAKQMAEQAKKLKEEALKTKALAQKQAQELNKQKQELAKKQQELQKEQLQLKQAADQKKQQAAQAAAQAQEQDITAKQTEIEHYKAKIAQQIYENRTLSSAFDPNLVCDINITLLPDGSVRSLRVLKSSGNPAYDESNEIAVYKAAPFDMPEDPKLFDELRDISFGFKV